MNRLASSTGRGIPHGEVRMDHFDVVSQEILQQKVVELLAALKVRDSEREMVDTAGLGHDVLDSWKREVWEWEEGLLL